MRLSTLSLVILFGLLSARSNAQPPEITTAELYASGPISDFIVLFASVLLEPGNYDSLMNQTGEVVWDFEDLDTETANNEVQHEQQECDAVPEAVSFPSCTKVYEESIPFSFISVKRCTEYSPPNLLDLGNVNTSTGEVQVNVCSQSRIIYEFPINFEDSHSSSYLCAPDELNSGYQVIDEGERTVSVDAYGTVILPSGSFSNCLKQQTIDEGTYENYYNGSFLVTNTYTITTTEFLKAGYPFPILRWVKTVLDGNLIEGSLPSYRAEYMISGIPTDLIDDDVTKPLMNIWPNPAIDVLNIDGLTEITAYQILCIDGRIVSAGNLTSYQNSIPIEGLAKGTYILQLENGLKRRFVLE